MRALVTGGTGFVGRRLMGHLGDTLLVSRRPYEACKTFPTSTVLRGDSPEKIAGVLESGPCEAVFHLAGEPVAHGRWTAEKKRRIRGSRVEGTRRIVDAIGLAKARPSVLVSSSAVGYYGSQGERILSEESSGGVGFLADVCREWEEEARRAESFGVRVVYLLIALVLRTGGGALGAMLTPFKLGLGGPLGPGNQWTPWIHIDDLVGSALFAARRRELRGPVNAVAPTRVRNRDLASALGRALHRPAILPAPAIALRAMLGDFADVLLASQRIVPVTALAAGYEFRHRDIDSAFRDIFSRENAARNPATAQEMLR